MRNEHSRPKLCPPTPSVARDKRRLKPGARGLMGSRGKAPAEYEAEPHSATAD